MENIKDKMELFSPEGDLLISIKVDDSSYRFKEIMGDNTLVLNFSYNEYLDIPLGSYCTFKNERYALWSPENFKKNHTEHFDYTLTLEPYVAQMKAVKFKFFTVERNEGQADKMVGSPKLKFSHTATPYDFARLLVDNLNMSGDGGSWSVSEDECLKSDPVTIDFNHDYCYSVLSKIAEAFDTEWEVDNKTIRIGKVEKLKDSAIKLSYGYNNGILQGISRKQYDSSKVINRVWIEGGDRNIDFGKYGNSTLLLPQNGWIKYDGIHFEGDELFDESKAIEYIVDASRSYVERTGREGALAEDSLDVTKIYPKCEGEATSVEKINDAKGLYNFTDKDSIDIEKSVIPGETMTVIFQTGQLAGIELEAKYKHSKKTFELVPKTDNGLVYPQGNIVPAAGDRYGVFHVRLPDETIKEAELNALKEAVKYLYENEQAKYTYDWQLDGIYAKKEWGAIGGFLSCGYFVNFSDPQFQIDPIDIRITAVKEFVNNPLSPEITISNNVSGKSISSVLNQIPTQEQAVERKDKVIKEYAARRWKDTQELIDGVKDMVDGYQTDLLSSLVFEGMIFRAGAASLQVRFLKEDWITNDEPYIEFDKATAKLHVKAPRIEHATIEIDGKKPCWNVADYVSDALTEAETPYYLYMRASKTLADVDGRLTGEASYYLSTEKIKLEDEDDFYTFWIAFVNSENTEGDRSYRTMYGFTEMLPGQITTDTLISSDGKSFLKLLANQMRIGGDDNSLEYNLDTEKPHSLVASNMYIKKALNVIGEALISGFYFSDQVIKSKAKNGGENALVLDGNNGVLQFNNYVQSWGNPKENNHTRPSVKQYIRIDSGDDAKVEARNINANEVAYLSSQGIFANKAGINTLPASVGVNLKAAIAGLGFGKMNNDLWNFDKDEESGWGIVGVYGTASNESTNPAPAYGGWFDRLRVNGLLLNSRRIDKTTWLTNNDCYISCYNSEKIGVVLPEKPYIGQIYYIRQMHTSEVVIIGKNGNYPGYLIHISPNVIEPSVNRKAGGDTSMLLFDGQFWLYNYMPR